MKKRFIIISAIFAALFSSCTEEAPMGNENSLTGTTTVIFTPDFGEDNGVPDTKVFDDNPQVQNLYLAVFTEGGKALVEYVKADPVTPAAKDTTDYAYSVTLKLSDQPRVIHFIANGPEELNYGSEEDAVGSLLCSFDKTEWTGQDTYWGYLELPHGICDQNASGYSTLCTDLSSVKLVRNFARINVTCSATNLVITRFWISNFPDRSSIAPYNREGRRFETRYAEYEYATDAMDAGYNGFCPTASGLVSISGLSTSELDEIAVPCTSDKYAYVYECEKPVKDALCIIVGGKFAGSADETFYKLEIRDADGKYLPILRDFTYTINIGKVEKAGESTVEDALNSVPTGGIDTNLDLKDLPDMSNGRSRIAVSYTEKTIFTADDIELEYLFVPDIVNNPTVVVNQTLDYLTSTGGYADEADVQANGLSYVTITSEPGLNGAVIDSYTVSTTDKSDGYRVIEMSPVAVSNENKSEVFTITGYVFNSSKGKYETIQRTVTYLMQQRPPIVLKLNPNKVLAAKVGEPLQLSIGIQANLPKSLFSLEMKISTEQGTLTPAGQDLPISSGLGVDNKPTYFMTRTITWDDYTKAATVKDNDGELRKYFNCQLMTNTKLFRDVSALIGQGDRIYVTSDKLQSSNIVFLAGNDAFYKFVNPHFDKESLAAGRSANIVFGMTGIPEDGTIFVRMNGIEPVDKTAHVYQRKEGDYTVWEMHVSDMNSESVEIVPTAGAPIGYFQLVDDEFNSSAIYSKEVKKLQFSALHLGLGTNDFVVVGREAQAKFHMSDTPLDGDVTIYLKNCKPKDTSLDGIGPDTDGYTAYVIPAKTPDVSFPVIINTGVNKASFKLTDAEFDNSVVEDADVDMLKFSDLHLGLGNNDYVVVGREAQAKFHMSDLPLDGDVTIYLNNCAPTDNTLTGTSAGSGYTKYVINVADYVVTGTSVDVIFPVTINTGVSYASFKLTDDEFTDSGEESAEVKKLQFTGLTLTNTDDNSKSYLLKDGNARISFSMGDMPLDNKITLALTNLNTPVAVSGVSNISGSGPYTLTVTGTDVILDVKVGSVSGVEAASYTLSDDEFDSATKKADVMTRYTIDWSKVQIWSDDPNAKAAGQSVMVYRNDATCAGTPIASFTTDGNGMASGTNYVLDAANGTTDKFYFKFTMNNNPNSGVDYISDGVNIGDIANMTSTVTVTCKIQMVDFTILAHKLKFNGCGGQTGYLRFDSQTNTTGQISFTIQNNNSDGYKDYNSSAISGRCKPGTKIYFTVGSTNKGGGETIETYTNGSVYNF